jgi:hypothetical protein
VIDALRIVVITTVIVMGGLTPFMLKYLKITSSGHDEPKDVRPDTATSTEDIQKSSADKKGSLTTLEEYMNPEHDADAAAEAAEFMDAMNNGFWMKLYELDKRYIKPFFSGSTRRVKRDGAVLYETQATMRQGRTGGDRLDTYEIRNNNVVSALDDSDDEDELDRVPIAVAAEMVCSCALIF